MDEVPPSNNTSTGNTVDLPLANHVDSFISPEDSFGTPKVLEMLARFDSPADKLAILPNNIVQIFDRVMFAALWQFT